MAGLEGGKWLTEAVPAAVVTVPGRSGSEVTAEGVNLGELRRCVGEDNAAPLSWLTLAAGVCAERVSWSSIGAVTSPGSHCLAQDREQRLTERFFEISTIELS